MKTDLLHIIYSKELVRVLRYAIYLGAPHSDLSTFVVKCHYDDDIHLFLFVDDTPQSVRIRGLWYG